MGADEPALHLARDPEQRSGADLTLGLEHMRTLQLEPAQVRTAADFFEAYASHALSSGVPTTWPCQPNRTPPSRQNRSAMARPYNSAMTGALAVRPPACGFLNSATGLDLGVYAAHSYSLMSAPPAPPTWHAARWAASRHRRRDAHSGSPVH
jgi:hypothetical protein